MTRGDSFRFGLEAEYLLVDARSYRPLWYRDLTFAELNALLESIPLDGLPPLDGLRIEPPHRKRMPYVVEGYHVTDADFAPIDILPKGVEIRTPICDSIEACLATLRVLHERLSRALVRRGFRAVAISFHPLEHRFVGPQNKRREDFWRWAMRAMLTYGPDINVGLPMGWFERLDLDLLNAKVNHYAPAMVALSVASPIYRGALWPGKSVRTHFRSVVAPAIEIHPDQDGRLEFKPFEMTNDLDQLHAYFLLWLEVLLDHGLEGRADDEDRIYDLGVVARFGLSAPGMRDRALDLLDRAPRVLGGFGFDPSPLARMRHRAMRGRDVADDIAEWLEETGSLPSVLARLEPLVMPGALGLGAQGASPHVH